MKASGPGPKDKLRAANQTAAFVILVTRRAVLKEGDAVAAVRDDRVGPRALGLI